MSPDASQRAQWLEVAQFQTEDRALQFREDFMWLVGHDGSGGITGPALAAVVAEESGLGGGWQVMDGATLEHIEAGEWSLVHLRDDWQPRLNDPSPQQTIETSGFDLDL